MGTFNPLSQRGQNFTIEDIDSGRLISKLSASAVAYDTTKHKWSAINYYIRQIKGNEEIITKGKQIDTALIIQPDDFSRDPGIVGTMTSRELEEYINQLKLQGSDELKLFLIEKYRRFANPFAVFILTLSFSYILFLQFASQFSLKGSLGPMLAMWIPNILYSIIGLVLYKLAPK